MSICLFFEIFCEFPLSATLSLTDTHSLETSRPCVDFEPEMAVWLLSDGTVILTKSLSSR